jgi:hypothetical protein
VTGIMNIILPDATVEGLESAYQIASEAVKDLELRFNVALQVFYAAQNFKDAQERERFFSVCEEIQSQLDAALTAKAGALAAVKAQRKSSQPS